MRVALKVMGYWALGAVLTALMLGMLYVATATTWGTIALILLLLSAFFGAAAKVFRDLNK